jgi:hypothetical protein
VPHEQEQTALARMMELHNAGASTHRIADTLTAEGHPTKRGDKVVESDSLAHPGRPRHRTETPASTTGLRGGLMAYMRTHGTTQRARGKVVQT